MGIPQGIGKEARTKQFETTNVQNINNQKYKTIYKESNTTFIGISADIKEMFNHLKKTDIRKAVAFIMSLAKLSNTSKRQCRKKVISINTHEPYQVSWGKKPLGLNFTFENAY